MSCLSWLVCLSASIVCKRTLEVELRAMAAQSTGLRLEIWNVREDKIIRLDRLNSIFVAIKQELEQLDGSMTMFSEGTSDAGIESLHPTHNIGQAF